MAALVVSGGISLASHVVLRACSSPAWAVAAGTVAALAASALGCGYILLRRIDRRVGAKQSVLLRACEDYHQRELQESRQQTAMASELGHFMPPALASELATGHAPLALDGRRCAVSVVYIKLLGLEGPGASSTRRPR